MSDPELDSLPPELEALLRTERVAPEPPARAADRVFGRLAKSIAALPPLGMGGSNFDGAPELSPGDVGSLPDAGGLLQTGATGAAAVGAGKAVGIGAAGAAKVGAATLATGGAAKTVGVLLASKLVLGTATFIAGGMVGAGVHAVAVREGPKRTEVIHRAPPPPPALALEEAVEEAPLPPPEPPAEVVATPKPPAREARKDRDALLGSERTLLEMARTALSRQKPEDALEALARHTRKFPKGQLKEERDALQVQALVGVGRYDDAREAASHFRLTYPSSLLVPAVDAAEREIP